MFWIMIYIKINYSREPKMQVEHMPEMESPISNMKIGHICHHVSIFKSI